MRLWILAILTLAAAWPLAASAHEVRPAYVQISETPVGVVHVLWKQPVVGQMAVPLAPHLSSGWLDRAPMRQTLSESSLVREWDITPPHVALTGQTLSVEGLERTITDVIVQWTPADGQMRTFVLRPDAPSMTLASDRPAGAPVLDYLRMGVMHIWTGFDHLLYVLGLLLLVRNVRTLLKTITAFTVAHSITLAAATLGLVHISPPAVEACIALSIVFVAVELVRADRGEQGLATRFPWAVAFSFGLLHGLGFASALQEVGLPSGQVAPALFLFNVGIELGQVAFVGSVLVLLRLVTAAGSPRLAARFAVGAPYVIGGVGAFWVLQRMGAVVGV